MLASTKGGSMIKIQEVGGFLFISSQSCLGFSEFLTSDRPYKTQNALLFLFVELECVDDASPLRRRRAMTTIFQEPQGMSSQHCLEGGGFTIEIGGDNGENIFISFPGV